MREDEETTGLVLKIMPIGKWNRCIAVPTWEKGKFSCFTHGAARQDSPLMDIAYLLVYGKFILCPGRNAGIVAAVGGLRFFGTLEVDALVFCYTNYFLGLIGYFHRRFQRREKSLRLLCFILLALGKPELPQGLVQHVLELKLLVLDRSRIVVPPLKTHESRACTWDYVV